MFSLKIIDIVSISWIWFSSFVGLFLLREVISFVVSKVHKNISTHQNEILKGVLKKTFNVFLIAFYSTYITSLFYDFDWKYYYIIQTWSLVIIIFLFFRLFAETVEFFENLYINALHSSERKARTAIIRLISTSIKVVVFIVLILFVLKVLGIDISTLLAGFGIGGVALAFGLQSILGDFFASLSLHFDHPFSIGDYIEVNDDSGTVKDIGLKTTRLTTALGDELVISNTDLASSRIRNFGKMRQRRVKTTLTIAYDTDTKKLEKVKTIVKKIIDEIDNAVFDRIHLKELGEYSINFGVVYHITSSDFMMSLDAQDKVNFTILKEFEKNEIKLAYPTQTVIVTKD